MIHMIFLIGGVCCALLCHWMIRHTYTYRLEETGKTYWIGRPEQRKVWDKKLVLPRWKYILICIFCILFAPIAVIAPIVVGVIISIACNEGETRFVYTNRFIEWLKKEI